MNIISNYSDKSLYTFETSIIGKEYLRVKKGVSQILIPGFQVELKFKAETRFFEKEYFLFNNVTSFKARYSYFDSDLVDEYTSSFPIGVINNKVLEFESLAFRDNSITFCTYIIEFETLDVYYDNQVFKVQDIYVSNLDFVIKKNELVKFLNLKEIDLDIDKQLHEILSSK